MIKHLNFVFLFLFFCCSTISIGPEGASANCNSSLQTAVTQSSSSALEARSKSLVVKSSFYDQIQAAFKEACKKAGLKENLKPKRTLLGGLLGIVTCLLTSTALMYLGFIILVPIIYGTILGISIFSILLWPAFYGCPLLALYGGCKFGSHCSQKYSGRGAHKKFYCEFSKSLKTIARELYQDRPNEKIDQIIDVNDSPVKGFDSKDFFLKNIFKSVLTSNVETREQALESVDFARAVAEILAK